MCWIVLISTEIRAEFIANAWYSFTFGQSFFLLYRSHRRWDFCVFLAMISIAEGNEQFSDAFFFKNCLLFMKRPAPLKKPARHVLKKPAVNTVKGGVCNPNCVSFLSERTATHLSREEFIARLKAFVATSVPGQHVEIGLSRRKNKEDKSTVFKHRIYCRSCKKCALNKGWCK